MAMAESVLSSLWEESNISCMGGQCSVLDDLGPPPDLILTLPPPPLPSFLANSATALSNASCSLCLWAGGRSVDYVEMPRQDLAIDDTWFFVIISVCVALTFCGIFTTIACLRLREQKKSRLSRGTPTKGKPSLGPGVDCGSVLYPGSTGGQTDGTAVRVSRALWAGLRTSKNHYTVEHAQPLDQKPNRIISATDSDAGYADISPQAYRGGEKVHILPARADDRMSCAVGTGRSPARRLASENGSLLRESYPLHTVPQQDTGCYEHCYEQPKISSGRPLYTADWRPLYSDENCGEDVIGSDVPVHIYEKPQYRTTGRSPKNRPKLLNSLNRSSPRPRRLAPPISNPRSLEHRHQMPPLNQRPHHTLMLEGGHNLLLYTPPKSHRFVNGSLYPSPVV